MKKKTIPSEEHIQSQVFELLGKTLYVCNSMELKLRWMHKHAGGIWVGKTPKDLLNAVKKSVVQQQKDDKRSLGFVGSEMLDAIYMPRRNKDFKDAEKQELFVFKTDYKIEGKGRLRCAKLKFAKFIEARNYLVHYFARDFNLVNKESYEKAFETLQSKSEIIKETAKFFEADFNMMKSSLQKLSKKLIEYVDSAMGRCPGTSPGLAHGVPARKGSER